jgi:hypothetical protein
MADARVPNGLACRTWSLVPQLPAVCRTFVSCDKVIPEGRVRSISTASASAFTLGGTHRSDAPPRSGSLARIVGRRKGCSE